MQTRLLASRCLIALTLTAVSPGIVPAQKNAKPAPGLRAVPIFQMAEGQKPRPRFRFAMLNTTGKPVRCLGPGEPYGMDLVLYHGAEYAKRWGPCWCAGPTAQDVRIIKAGGFAETEFDFEMYRRLKPGRHELIGFFPFAKTHWAVEKFRLTPMRFMQSMMILDVGGKPAVEKDRKQLIAPEGKKRTYYRKLLAIRKTNAMPGLRSIPIVTLDSKTGFQSRLRFGFQNVTGKPLRYMQGHGGVASCAGLRIVPVIDGKPLKSHAPNPKPVAFVKNRVQTLKPNECIRGELNLAHFRITQYGRYNVQAEYEVAKTDQSVRQFGLTPQRLKQTIMFLDLLEPVPAKLTRLKQYRFRRVDGRNSRGAVDDFDTITADIGLGPTRNKQATLFVLARRAEKGQTKPSLQQDHTFRPARIDPAAKIQTMLYNPFPLATERLMLLHILVSEPKKPQRYFVLDLTRSPPEMKTTRTLPASVRYRLRKRRHGPVVLERLKGRSR